MADSDTILSPGQVPRPRGFSVPLTDPKCTQTEFMFSKFCAEEKLKTKTSEYPGLSVDAGELSRLQQLIIQPGEGGGIIMQTELCFQCFAQKKS